MIKVTKKIEDYQIIIESDAELSKDNLAIIFEELFGSKITVDKLNKATLNEA